MLHSLFVPHIVVTVPQNWLGVHKTGVNHYWHTKLGSVPLCRSHGWTVVNHYCTQNWGPTMCFLRQCCTHCLCPTLWPLCPKTGSVLAMQPLCRSHDWTVVNHYCTQNWGLTMCFLRQCCTHSLCPTLWSLCPKTGSEVLAMGHVFFAAMLHSLCAPKLARSWPCSLCAEVMDCGKLDCGKSLLPHTKHSWVCTQNWGLTMCFLRQCCTHCLCPTLWPLCPKTGSVLAMQPQS